MCNKPYDNVYNFFNVVPLYPTLHLNSLHLINIIQICLTSLQPLQNCISSYMLKKIAHSGLYYHHLQLALQRGGAEGIENIFGEKNDDGKVRATRTKSVIAKIFDHFNALNQKE